MQIAVLRTNPRCGIDGAKHCHRSNTSNPTRSCLYVFVAFLSLAAQSTTADAQTLSGDAEFLTNAAGCKFVNPFPDEESPLEIEWTGECVDGFVNGQGDVTVVGPRRTVYHGEFEQGEIKAGRVTRDGGTYEGGFRRNQPHGKGAFISPSGDFIKATFVDGKPLGDFVEAQLHGSRYEGSMNVKTMTMEGKGALIYPDGSTYEGMFRNNMPNGEGVMKLASGEVRRGEFLHGELQGKGLIEWSNGTRYEGELQGGKPHGQGKFEWPNDAVYEGAFAGGLQQGKGKLAYANGDTYEGDFLGGHPHGIGIYRFIGGDVYEGAYVSGQRHGHGRMTYSSGTVSEGEWKQGNLHGKCRFESQDFTYEGECISGQYFGYGRLEERVRGEVYEGEFRDGYYDGKGKLVGRDSVYEGTFRRGMKEGIGKETFADGSEYEGGFAQNLRHGRGVMKAKSPDGQDIIYDGELSSGVLDGSGVLTVGSRRLEGRFQGGFFVQGRISEEGRTFEIDIEEGKVLEILPDGTKQPLDQLPLELGI